MSEEHEIQKKIQVALSKKRCTVFRTNVGKVQKIDGSWFDTGLPKGFPDLIGFRWQDGKIFFIEVKTPVGSPSKAQIRFHNFLKAHDIVHGLARNVQDALHIVERGAVGYGFEK